MKPKRRRKRPSRGPGPPVARPASESRDAPSRVHLPAGQIGRDGPPQTHLSLALSIPVHLLGRIDADARRRGLTREAWLAHAAHAFLEAEARRE